MPLTPGTLLGPYEIQAAIGSGGMGEVYRARDTRLKRDVAIKILPDHFAQDPERLARFQREAELLATLNHPHIAQIYGLEDRALVLELVEGPTLADRIKMGPIPVDEALAIALQMTEALEAAHERGIIHRDLKPGNIKLTGDGKVKVLDFGLAKAVADHGRAHSSQPLSMSPTITSPAMTMGGVILGTAAYMSPEQARGNPADKRSDIWAFGCILFEMLSGRPVFEGDTVSDILAAVLRTDPTWSALPQNTPVTCVRLIRRCLARDRVNRLADIADARLELLDAVANIGHSEPARHKVTTTRVPALIAGTAAIVAAAIAIAAFTRPAPAVVTPMRFTIVTPPTQPILAADAAGRRFALSPDGQQIVYATQAGLYVRTLNQLAPVPLRGADFPYTRSIFFSPDGRWVGFGAAGELKKVPITGGPAITICRVPGNGRGATWLPDGTIVFAARSHGLMRVAASGGEPEVLTTLAPENGEGLHGYPSAVPGRNAVLFTISNLQLDSSSVAVFDLDNRSTQVLIKGGSSAQFVEPGYLIYSLAGTLMSARFDASQLKVLGDPVPVVEGVVTKVVGGSEFDISQGTLVYVPGGPGGTPLDSATLVWVDRQGREEPLGVPDHEYRYPRLSPDDSRIAVDALDLDRDIWLWEFESQTLRRLTFGSAQDQSPVWLPDGRHIVFASGRDGGMSLYSQDTHGGGKAQRLTTSPNVQASYSATPDGTSVIFRSMESATGVDLSLLQTRNREITPLIRTPFHDNNGEVSPDGRWMAYESNESGRFEVYVRPFPATESAVYQISTEGGTLPAWGRDGRELFYIDADQAMVSVPVQTGTTFRAGRSTKLFDASPYSGRSQSRMFDVARDGKRFLMTKSIVGGSSATPANMVVVLNWLEELRARNGTAK